MPMTVLLISYGLMSDFARASLHEGVKSGGKIPAGNCPYPL